MKIVVIEAFGLHLGYLGCYGNDWVATPNLDRLAMEGVVFEWHIADQPELAPITPWHERSVATGTYAWEGRKPSIAPGPRVVRCESLAHFADLAVKEITANADWLWIEGPSLLPPWKLDEDLLDIYFDDDDVDEGLAPWRNPAMAAVPLNDAEVLQLQNTYAAVVTFFDAQLGKLLNNLPGRDDVLLCVTARSGLPLGEHGMIGTPRPTLHGEFVHVPLLMRLPNSADGGLRIGALTQPIDLRPTFLEALGQPVPEITGKSLWPLLRGENQSVRPFAVSNARTANEQRWLIRTPEHAYHVQTSPADGAPATPLLFVKPEDRWEVNNLCQPLIEQADALDVQLREFLARTTPPES